MSKCRYVSSYCMLWKSMAETWPKKLPPSNDIKIKKHTGKRVPEKRDRARISRHLLIGEDYSSSYLQAANVSRLMNWIPLCHSLVHFGNGICLSSLFHLLPYNPNKDNLSSSKYLSHNDFCRDNSSLTRLYACWL